MKRGFCLTSGMIAACVGVLLIVAPIMTQAATTTRTAPNGQVIYELETTINSAGQEVRATERNYTAEGRLTWYTLYNEKGQAVYSEHLYEDGTRYILVRDPKTNALTQVYDLDENRGEESVYSLDRFWFKAEAMKRYVEDPAAREKTSNSGSGHHHSRSSGSSNNSSTGGGTGTGTGGTGGTGGAGGGSGSGSGSGGAGASG